jgi:hypothetical protein
MKEKFHVFFYAISIFPDGVHTPKLSSLLIADKLFPPSHVYKSMTVHLGDGLPFLLPLLCLINF